MNVVITGGTGFIGRHVLRGALASGHAVMGLCRKKPTDIAPDPKLRWVSGELDHVSQKELAKCDVLIHLAAYGVLSGKDDWDECFGVNVTRSLSLWRLAATSGIRRFVICGSCFEYGTSGECYNFIPFDAPLKPVGAYATSKAAASIAAMGLAAALGLDMTVVRPFHVFGEGEYPSRLWPSLRAAALQGSDFAMTEGAQVRDFCPVQQIAKSILELATVTDEPRAQIRGLNLGSGKPQSLKQFAEDWWRVFQAKGQLKFGVLPYRKDEVMRYVPQL